MAGENDKKQLNDICGIYFYESANVLIFTKFICANCKNISKLCEFNLLKVTSYEWSVHNLKFFWLFLQKSVFPTYF